MAQELSYSFHLGNDKNKTKRAKQVAQTNTSGATSYTNNAIQNAKDLSDANKHNLRDYDKQRELIRTIYGTNNIVTDVKNVYLKEFENARLEYNKKQTRNDRLINNYFNKVSDSQNDLACEIIIELGDKDFWNDKDNDYKLLMVDVFEEQINDLINVVSSFKIANATAHFDETSPHLHIIGVPVIDNCKRGMTKQVGKSKVFTKESLTAIQDKMRLACIKSFNKVYNNEIRLREKEKGRNKDINVKDMKDYKEFKAQYDKHNKKLRTANKKIDKVNENAIEVNSIIDNLKPTPFNKKNKIISDDDVTKIKEYVKQVENTTKTMKSVNELNVVIDEFENSYSKMEKTTNSLSYEIELKDGEINYLKKELSSRDKVINKLQTEIGKLKNELNKFKEFWYKTMKRFHNKICFDKDESYKCVSDDLHNAGIFSDDEFEIATNALRKVKPRELPAEKNKKKNDMNLN